MSALNGGVVHQQSEETFFTELRYTYDPVVGKVESLPFITTCSQILPIFDTWGRAFKFVKYDLNSNIQAVKKYYESDPKKYTYIDTMLEEDAAKGKRNIAEPLLWLKRGLDFIRMFLELLGKDLRNDVQQESLVPILETCYKSVLKRYHGIVVQKFFSLSMKLVPWRRDLLKGLCNNRMELLPTLVDDFDQFLLNMTLILEHIDQLYDKLNLHSNSKSNKI